MSQTTKTETITTRVDLGSVIPSHTPRSRLGFSTLNKINRHNTNDTHTSIPRIQCNRLKCTFVSYVIGVIFSKLSNISNISKPLSYTLSYTLSSARSAA